MQSKHLHFIIEADNNDILTTGMRSLTITFAKGLNQGKVQIQRYHLHVLKGIQETKNAINYVLFNKQKHEKGTSSTVDEYTSIFGMYELMKSYAKFNRVTLKIGKLINHSVDEPRSYLLKILLRP